VTVLGRGESARERAGFLGRRGWQSGGRAVEKMNRGVGGQVGGAHVQAATAGQPRTHVALGLRGRWAARGGPGRALGRGRGAAWAGGAHTQAGWGRP
jgi:hypothetical protein